MGYVGVIVAPFLYVHLRLASFLSTLRIPIYRT